MAALDVHGERIALHWLLPGRPRGSVLLIHGYLDHVGLYGHLLRWALDHDLAVLAYDLPGHGLSSGEPAFVASFEDYQAVLTGVMERFADLMPRPVLAVGQSTGGAILMEHLLRAAAVGASSRFDGAALLAPLVRPMGWPLGGWVLPVISRFATHMPRRARRGTGDPEFAPFLARDPLQAERVPLAWTRAMQRWLLAFLEHPPCEAAPLVIQGDADRTVDWPYNLRVVRSKFPRAEIHILPGASHHLANEAIGLRQRKYALLDGWLETLLPQPAQRR